MSKPKKELLSYFNSSNPPSLPLTKPTPISLRLAGVLLFFLYPFVVLADLMGLAAESRGKVPIMDTVIEYAIIFGTLAYPAVYFICLAIWRHRSNSGRTTGILICIFPLIYLLLPLLTIAAVSGYLFQYQRP